MEAETPEMKQIKIEEKQHFTPGRIVFILICTVILFTAQFAYKSPEFDRTTKRIIFTTFAVLMLLITYNRVHKIKIIHEIKTRDNYDFDEHDTRFDTFEAVVTLSAFCMIAAILCGLTGIAGGMVLGPLFLRYNMLPSIMSGTNQYITMVASIAVAVQFIYIGYMNYYYAATFGILTLLSAYSGITVVNKIVSKSGKQSVIALLLFIALICAFTCLPLNYIIKG